jgi:hypothetical protein
MTVQSSRWTIRTSCVKASKNNLRSMRVGQVAAVNLRLPGDGRADARFDDQPAAMVAARDEGLIAGLASAMSASNGFFACPWKIGSVVLRWCGSPGSGDASSPAWRQAW